MIEDLAYQIALQGVKHNYFSNFERGVCWPIVGSGRWVASLFSLPQGETDAPALVRANEWVWERGRVRVSSSTPSAWRVKTPHLSPLSLPKGRGEKGWQVNFIYQS